MSKVRKVLPLKILKEEVALFSSERRVLFSLHNEEFLTEVHESNIKQGNLFVDVVDEDADTLTICIPGTMSEPNVFRIPKGDYVWCYQIMRIQQHGQ